MRHGIKGYKLGRNTPHRQAMWRNMSISLLTHGQITTTLPKAKSLRPFVEKLITLAKKGDLASRRRVIQMIGDPIMVRHEDDEDLKRSRSKPNRPDGYQGKLQDGPRLVKHLFEEIAPKYADRDGGYTRIVKLGIHRIGDGGDMVVIQLVGEEGSGGQLSGQYSRRRDKANRRMEFAAKLRKAGKGGDEAAAPEVEAEAATAVEQAPEADEQPTEEAAADEETTEEDSAPEPEASTDDEEKKD